MLKKIRIALATICFAAITLLLLDISGTLHMWFGWLARVQLVPAALAQSFGVVAGIMLLTLLFGRIYCSVICPLGVMQDVISHFAGKKKNRFSFSKDKPVLRWGFVAAFILLIATGLNAAAAIIAPYSSYGRIAAELFAPLYIAGNNILSFIAERVNNYAFYPVDIYIKSLPTFLIAAATFVILFVLAWRGGRTYCNTVCPVGTVLGLISRISIFKIRIDKSKCNACTLCEKNCKASCIDSKNHKIDYSRCVSCGNCIDKCNKHAIGFSFKKSTDKKAAASENNINAGRRAFLVGAAAFVSAAAKTEEKKVDGGLAMLVDKVPPKRDVAVLPPGSGDAASFYAKCTDCMLCVTKCTNNVLHPSANLLHLMQPEMSFERGSCRPECTACGDVCPTGAIKPFTKEEKTSIQIGHAVYIQKNCITYTDEVNCDNCARHCPTQAITMVPAHSMEQSGEQKHLGKKQSGGRHDEGRRRKPHLIPSINEARCIGCGICEYICPARPVSAIFVQGHEEHKVI